MGGYVYRGNEPEARLRGELAAAPVERERVSPREATRRERVKFICQRLVLGWTHDKIAAALGVTRSTAATHIKAQYKDRDVHSQMEFAVRAVREGWVKFKPLETQPRQLLAHQVQLLQLLADNGGQAPGWGHTKQTYHLRKIATRLWDEEHPVNRVEMVVYVMRAGWVK